MRFRRALLSARLRLRCEFRGHEWRENRPTRCVKVTSCAICGLFMGWSIDRSDPERECLWFKPSMVKPLDADEMRREWGQR